MLLEEKAECLRNTLPFDPRSFKLKFRIHYCPQTKFAKVMFLQVSVCPQGGVRDGGACMAGRGGHAWLGACVTGGVHGRGACVEGGVHDRGCVCGGGGHVWQGKHAWQGGVWQGHAWQACRQGVCMAGHARTP